MQHPTDPHWSYAGSGPSCPFQENGPPRPQSRPRPVSSQMHWSPQPRNQGPWPFPIQCQRPRNPHDESQGYYGQAEYQEPIQPPVEHQGPESYLPRNNDTWSVPAGNQQHFTSPRTPGPCHLPSPGNRGSWPPDNHGPRFSGNHGPHPPHLRNPGPRYQQPRNQTPQPPTMKQVPCVHLPGQEGMRPPVLGLQGPRSLQPGPQGPYMHPPGQQGIRTSLSGPQGPRTLPPGPPGLRPPLQPRIGPPLQGRTGPHHSDYPRLPGPWNRPTFCDNPTLQSTPVVSQSVSQGVPVRHPYPSHTHDQPTPHPQHKPLSSKYSFEYSDWTMNHPPTGESSDVPFINQPPPVPHTLATEPGHSCPAFEKTPSGTNVHTDIHHGHIPSRDSSVNVRQGQKFSHDFHQDHEAFGPERGSWSSWHEVNPGRQERERYTGSSSWHDDKHSDGNKPLTSYDKSQGEFLSDRDSHRKHRSVGKEQCTHSKGSRGRSRSPAHMKRKKGQSDSVSPVHKKWSKQLSPSTSSPTKRSVQKSNSPDSSTRRTHHSSLSPEPWLQHSQSESRSQSPSGCSHHSHSRSPSHERKPEKHRGSSFPISSKEMEAKLEQLARMKPEEIIEQEKKVWTRSAPADLYYSRDFKNPYLMLATSKLQSLCDRFEEELVKKADRVKATKPKFEPPPRKQKLKVIRHKESHSLLDSSSSSDGSSDEDEVDTAMEELERKRQHPYRLHPELWYNDPGEMNDGPLCRCSARARRSGLRHGIFPGESFLPKCDPDSNNANHLYHYRITISPPTNFLTKTPTIIKHDEHEFIFEGFSMFSHYPLDKLPTCKVIRFNIEYTILYIDEKMPENFTMHELELFSQYLFTELLELVDLDFHAAGDTDGCPQFHFMPRFVRDLSDNGKEILSMNEVLSYLLSSSKYLIEETELATLLKMPQYEWQNFADEVKGMIVTYPGMKPCSVRVDQLDRDQVNSEKEVISYPEIVHFGIRPPQLSYAGNPEYQKAWREYVKFRHLLANMPKPSFEDKRKLEAKENKLQEMRTQSKMKRDVTVAVASQGFFRTGIMCDIVQHAMLLPVLVCHMRFHRSLDVLEKDIDYKFKNRYLLQLALTHPSYRENFGTNPDHARNSLTNCGIRQPEYGDRRIHYMNTRKRGINTLINIMSRFGKKQETESNITHNERLEFLGDAVVEFLTSIHLFHMFPDLEEGGLATYRAAIVQNQHLAVLAKTLNLEQFMLYAHGSDLCHDLELRHAMANCFEALMGALFLDGDIEVSGRVFASTLFKEEPELLDVWANYPPHPLQDQEPRGDRKWITSFPLLQKLTNFEESIGVDFTHIRLLARAFTDRSIGYNNLTLGSNQRLEFLGDTVLQLISSEYLYKFFPEHHEGHLSLLRSSLVNNRTQAVVCDDLGMAEFALYSNPKAELKTKDRADLLEAFLGALYVDKALEYCRVFCDVCFFPRLQDFIMNQDWNDPKSKLQQCCLTLRTMDGGEPDIPIYKVIECKGPTNTRVYTVAVYFRGKRLAKASGHSIQQAEMNAAKEALDRSKVKAGSR